MGVQALRRAVLTLALAGLLASPLACASRKGPPSSPIPDRRVQLARAQDLAMQAQQAYEKGDLDKAVLLSREAVAAARDYGQAWNNLGLFLMERNELYDAREAFAIASDLLPGDPRPLCNLGVMYLRSGWSEKALGYFERALERAPSDVPALRGAIDASLRLRRHDERTLERLERAILVEPDAAYRLEFQIRRAQVADELKEQKRQERESALRG